MKSVSQPHHLLILSQHYETYKLLIEPENLPGLSIAAFSEPNQVKHTANRFDVVFGEPSLVGSLLNQLPDLKWLHSS
jgi:hypothetical protein